MEQKIVALGIILNQALHQQKDMENLITRGVVRGKPGFELQFKDVEGFLLFEDELKGNDEMFGMLVSQLSNITAKGEEKYIKSCWRHIMKDSVALNFCWKGTLTKPSIQTMTTTAAIKEAFHSKFPVSSDNTFEQTCISFFQYAKARYTRKNEYKGKQL